MATKAEVEALMRAAIAEGNKKKASMYARLYQSMPDDAPAAPQAPAQAEPQTSTQQAAPGSLNEDDLREDPDWVEASRLVYEQGNGAPPPADWTPRQLADYGLDTIGMFNNNIAASAFDAASLITATPEQKKAFLYLMDGSEKLGWSWEAFGQGAKGIVTDPTTYIGLGTLGVGTAVSQGGKVLSRAGLKELLKSGINYGFRGAVEGATQAAAQNAIKQSVKIQAGAQEGFDMGEVGLSAAGGAVVGTALGGTVGVGETLVKNVAASKANAAAEALFSPTATITPTPPAAAAAPVAPPAPRKNPYVHAANENPPPVFNPQTGQMLKDGEINPLTGRKQKTPAQRPTDSIALNEKMPDDLRAANAPPPNDNVPSGTGPFAGAQHHLDRIVNAIQELAPTDVTPAIRQVDGVQKMKLLNAATKGISDMLDAAARIGDGATLSDLLERTGVTAAQMQVLKNSAQQANDKLLREIVKITEQARAKGTSLLQSRALRNEVDKLEMTRSAVNRLDMDLSTQSGRDLRMRQEGLNAGEVRGLTLEALQKEGGLSRRAAEGALLHAVRQRETGIQTKIALDALRQRQKIALDAGDFTALQDLRAQEKTLLGASDSQPSADPKTPLGKVVRVFHRALEGVLEVMIANVFSTSTIIINTIPTYLKIVTKPFMNYVATGIAEPAAFRSMIAGYQALGNMQQAAFSAASLAFKYERSLLMQDTERAFLGNNVIPKKFGGGVIRFIPRILNATDEYMAQIAYRSWGVSQATTAAMEDAKLLGLSGKKLEAHIKKAVEEATERLYSAPGDKAPHIVDLMLDQAQDRGLSGEKANAWIKRQLAAHPEQLRQAENEAGRDYVKDLLFKREFSGKSAVSQAARGYEQFTQRNPIMKIAGQLFFRTPIRVFEEGIRLTPGLNLIAPNFLMDLAGKNGMARQIRAQGEAMAGYGFAAGAFALFASGSITGAGPQDFRQRRQGENTDDFEPYTITLPNGEKWSYRNLDPIATPLKIIVNALERLEVLEYRRKQGEPIGRTELDQALAYIGVGTGAIAQAVADANLVAGVANTYKFFESLNDPRAGSQGDNIIKAIHTFLSTVAIPSTWTKSQLVLGEGFQNDPVTAEQVWRAKINPNDPLVPRQYTALGSPRKLSNAEANMWVFNPSTPEARKRGRSEHELKVEEYLWVTTQGANTDFTAPYKDEDILPEIPDLRKQYTRDGKETYYDRWQRYVHESDLIETLYTEVVSQDIPLGVPGNSMRADTIRSILKSFRDQALLKLRDEEIPSIQGLEDAATKKALQRASNNLNTPFK